MNTNWRAMLGISVLVEFSNGTFGIRKRLLPFLPITIYRDFKADMWWTKGSRHFHDCQWDDRGFVERYLLKGFKRRITEKVLPTNLKVIRAEHLLQPAPKPNYAVGQATFMPTLDPAYSIGFTGTENNLTMNAGVGPVHIYGSSLSLPEDITVGTQSLDDLIKQRIREAAEASK